MKNRRNYYRILQVQPDAPVEVIRASYKALMRDLRQHPDLGGDLWNAQILNAAFDTLSDENKRLAYDRELFERYTKLPFRDTLTGKPPLISLFCPFCKRPLARRATPEECCPTCRSPLRSSDPETLRRASRRSLPRIRKSEIFHFYTTWPQKGLEGKMIDVSKEGLRFQCRVKLSPGTLIKISGAFIRGVARITNVHKIHKTTDIVYSVGGKFVSVTFRETRGGFYSRFA